MLIIKFLTHLDRRQSSIKVLVGIFIIALLSSPASTLELAKNPVVSASLRPTLLIRKTNDSSSLDTHDGGSRLGIQGSLPRTKQGKKLGYFNIEHGLNFSSSKISTNVRHAYWEQRSKDDKNVIKIGKTDSPSSYAAIADVFDYFGNAFGQDLDKVSNMAVFEFYLTQDRAIDKDYLIPQPPRKYVQHEFRGKVGAIIHGDSENAKDINALDMGFEYEHNYTTVSFGTTKFINSDESDYLGVGFRYFTSDILSLSAQIEKTDIEGLSYHLVGERSRNDHTFRFGFAENNELKKKAITLGYSRPISKWAKYSIEAEQIYTRNPDANNTHIIFYLQLDLKRFLPAKKLFDRQRTTH